MSTMQDAINAQREEMDRVVAAVEMSKAAVREGAVSDGACDSSAEAISSVEEFDEDTLHEAIQQRYARLMNVIEMIPAEDATLEVKRNRVISAEKNLRALYHQMPVIESALAGERQKLAVAVAQGFRDQVKACQIRIDELESVLAASAKNIAVLEARYPELKAKIESEWLLVVRHHEFLAYFARETKDDGLTYHYTAKGVPTPGSSTLALCDTFLKARVEAAIGGDIITEAKGAQALFVGRDGGRWVPKHPEIEDGAEICRAMTEYAHVMRWADQERLEKIADQDVQDKVLLPPSEVARLKEHPENQHNILRLIEARHGFCIVRVRSDAECDLMSYRGVCSNEMLVEYIFDEKRAKEHTIRIAAVTAPHLVDAFFYPGGEKYPRNLVFGFNHPHDMLRWERTEKIVKDSLIDAFRKAEYRQKEVAVLQELSEITDLKTVDEIADGTAGTAVVLIPKYHNRFDLGFAVVSDGTTVKAGLATEKSQKLRLYEDLLDGQPVAEFFIRNADGSFRNEDLEHIAVLNETSSELGWLIPGFAATYAAEQISAANISGLTMPVEEGGKDGTYLFTVSVRDRDSAKEREKTRYSYVDREVGYVVARTNDKVVFVDGLTRYSRDRFVGQGFAFGAPYALNEVRGRILYVLQRLMIEVAGMAYGALPEHLKGAKARIQDPGPR